MTPKETLTRATLRTPKAAAIAGILFSVLMTTALLLLRASVPADPLEQGAWLNTNARVVAFALNLTLCRHRLPVVHRRAAGSAGRA
jgi:hypothetical protein